MLGVLHLVFPSYLYVHWLLHINCKCLLVHVIKVPPFLRAILVADILLPSYASLDTHCLFDADLESRLEAS